VYIDGITIAVVFKVGAVSPLVPALRVAELTP